MRVLCGRHGRGVALYRIVRLRFYFTLGGKQRPGAHPPIGNCQFGVLPAPKS